jgi:hypothetical protein
MGAGDLEKNDFFAHIFGGELHYIMKADISKLLRTGKQT